MSRRRKRSEKAISDLNITNLIDVMLVLLIIFMITAPMMTQGVQVDLPKLDAENVEVKEYIQVAVNKRNEVYINQERVTLYDFQRRFKQVFAGRTQIPVFVCGDKTISYGIVLRLISEIQSAGAVKLGFLTEPLPKTIGKN